ncbi:14875_t:CDS:2, partial [Cetraspora pellucida]
RKQICEYSTQNPSANQQDIADEFKRRYPELNLDRSTYLQLEENIETQNRYKNRGPKYPLVEKAMNIWVGQVSAAGLVLTDELVKSKGLNETSNAAENDSYQLNSDEDIMNNFSGSKDGDRTEGRLLEEQQRPREKTRGRPCGSSRESSRGSSHGKQDKILPNTNEANVETTDQHTRSDALLENEEIEEIVARLPDESFYAPETAQAISTYLQIIDESIATEEVLDDKGIVSMLQAEENEELIGQKDEDKDEEPDPPVTAVEAYDAMQTIVRYEEQESLESNLSLEELGFLRKLLREYKCVYEKSKKQTKITSFFNFQDSRSYSQDSPFQDQYSQDQDSHFQDPYYQDTYSQDMYSQGSYSQDSDSQELYSQDSYVQDSFYSQDSYF